MPLAYNRSTRLIALISALTVVFLSLPAPGLPKPPKAAVTSIKHWSNPSYTRVAINLSEGASYTHKLIEKDPSINKPRRLYIDIAGASLPIGAEKSIHINDGLLKDARAGQFSPDTVRVVLDIESIQDYKVFPLSDPFRIVVDVTGEKTAAALKEDEARLKAAHAKGETKPGAAMPKAGVRDETPLTAPKKRRLRIVLDPGHGGKDPGAIGRRGLKEKDVTLKLSKLLRDRLSKDIRASSVITTRDADEFIPLEERTAIANKNDADLFVSIHINASPGRNASGIETYILNIANDEEARKVAERENATSRKAVDDLEYILTDLMKTAKTNDSVLLATAVNGNVVNSLSPRYSGVKSNGVKGAPFYVLVGTRMPAILVEVSFISNPVEEKRLRDERYLRAVADGISKGIIEYLKNGKQSVQAYTYQLSVNSYQQKPITDNG
ncbi:MAG: N-acetylmuramoyl-L-alanine amidase [Deltaproteobacteria bacterium]|nr:N-acetylmuramoyl-L-alanine amidase [Deltaproteobacteria bacterium]